MTPHQQRVRRIKQWWPATGFVAACLVFTPVARAADPENCLLCHQFRGLSRLDEPTGRVHMFFVDPDYHHSLQGPHARLACTDCHPREEVAMIPHAPVSRVDCTRTCHLRGSGEVARRFSHTGVAEALQHSVHSPEALAKLSFTGGPLLDKDQSHCLYCHDEPLFRDPRSAVPQISALGEHVFDRCDVCHRQQLPTDVAYYLRHVASRLQPARSNLEQAQVCAVCHSDPAITSAHELSDTVASWVRSFHGKAALLGDQRTADCIACHAARGHNPHQLLSREDSASPVHPTRVADTCSSLQCHPGAAPSFGQAAVHLDLPTARGTLEFALAAMFILLTVGTFGPSALLVLLELAQIVIGRRHQGDSRLEIITRSLMADPRGRQRLKRFTVSQRMLHWALAVIFVALAVTGFPLKFAESNWSASVIQLMGGLTVARNIHHWAGIALVIGFTVYTVSLGGVVLKRARERLADGRRRGVLSALFAMPMWITLEDGQKLLKLLAYLLYLRSERPTFGRFSIKEKFEYIGVFWGTVLLGVTGALLWGETVSSHFLTGRAFNLATIAHTYEAFLAVIHVGILHIYGVMLAPSVFPLSLATVTGDTPEAELVESHSEFVMDAAAELGVTPESGT